MRRHQRQLACRKHAAATAGWGRGPGREPRHRLGLESPPMTESTLPSAWELTFEQLAARRGQPAVVVLNVLSAEQFAAAHVPGSLNLPLAEIESRVATLIPDRRAEVIVHCANDT